MFMRHFGHGVGHLQYVRQLENEPDDHDNGMELVPEDVSDSTDLSDHADAEDLEIAGEEESYNVEVFDDEPELGGDWAREGDSDTSDSDTTEDGSDCGGYASY
jgi:hypothetical protein